MANYDPLYLTLNDKPQAILQVIDDLAVHKTRQVAGYGWRSRLPWLFVLMGVVLLALDFVGDPYGGHILFVPAIGSLVAAIVLWVMLRRARPGQLPPRLAIAREIIHTLRDDIDPKRTFAGQVDLRGAALESKLHHTGKNLLGFPVDHYRDEWLGLKLKLYDGNVLRFAAVQRQKVRRGYHKRSASGKQKWKAPKVAADQELKIKLAVNPAVYDLGLREQLRPGTAIGPYQVSSFAAANGVLTLSVVTEQPEVGAAEVLAVMRRLYDLLQRKGEA